MTKGHQRSKRDELIRAAISAFSQFGVEGTSIDNILDLTMSDGKRISRRTYYKYFKDKEEITNEVIDYFREQTTLKYFPDRIENYENLQPIEKLETYVDMVYFELSPEFIHFNQIFFRMFIDKKMQEALNIKLVDYNRARRKYIQEILDEIGTKNSVHKATIILNLLRGFLLQYVSYSSTNIEFPDEKEREEMLAEIKKVIRQIASDR
ncbi:MAG: TetR/AcrR family transcriptional regulator [Candidatus Heimdallarchaeota archaeon]|nr:TetR/AcrR family transcriptional regulator [Candidatus Heimdallarchaeota archaeon]